MSNYAILHDTTLELRRQIVAALVSAPDADLELTENEITFALPTNDLTGSPRLSIYLYHVEPDANLRNQKRLSVGAEGQRLPPLALTLHYLITPLDEQEPVNHLMLGRILQYFHDNPFFVSLNGVPLDNSFGGNSTQFRILLEALSMEQLSQIWGALNADYRLALGYTVRTVAIDSDQGVTEAHRVVTMHTVVGQHK
jgi:hypothetical protein